MTKCILIIEDNVNSANMIKKIIASIDPSVEVLTAANSEAAYRQAMEKDIDVFIIDIVLDTKVMGDTSGIKFAECIRGIQKYLFTPFIFTTSLEDPQLYAFRKLHCYGYLEKPIDVTQAEELIRGALRFENTKSLSETIYFKKDKIIYPIDVDDIIYTRNENHEMTVYHRNGTRLTIPYKTCSQLLKEVRTNSLVQCSRNTLVNKRYIESVDLVNRFITLDDSEHTKVDIGSSFIKKLERKIK